MNIQPISAYSSKNNCRPTRKLHDNPNNNEVNFKGLKGFLTGGAIGAGVTAAGVTVIAGVAALPLFTGYIVANGVIAALSGHLAQNKKG